MRIGIDGGCWANRRGFGRFTRALVDEMRRRTDDDLVLLLDSVSAADPALPPVPAGVEVATAHVRAAPSTAAAAAGGRSIGDVARMGRAARRLRCDAFFFPASYSYFPVLTAPVVVAVHDAIADRRPDLTLPSRGDRVRWWLKQRAALAEARTVITVSDASREALVDALGVADERIAVIREAPDGRFRAVTTEQLRPVLERHGLPADARYVLYVGGISPHKNLEVLVRAFELAARDDPVLQLVVVGDADDDPFLSAAASLRAAIARSPVRDRIRLTGYVSDDDLVALYGAAVATALPSLGEGFGLTAAESAACGTPVVASRDAALVELLGDAGLYADADDAAGFAAHFLALACDPAHRSSVAAAVAARASQWNWEAAADTTVDVLHRAVRRRG